MSSPEPLPPDLATAAAPLGTPAVPHAALGAGCLMFAVAYAIVAAGLFFCGVGYMVIQDPQTPAKDKWMGWACAAVVGLPCIGFGAWMRRRFKSLESMRVWTMPGGLAWASSQGRGVARWEELEKLFAAHINVYQNGRLVRQNIRYTVHTRAGQSFVISEFLPDAAALGRQLEDQLVKHRLPAALEAYRAGTPVAFGTLTVSRTGLACGTASLAWTDVEQLAVEAGYLSIRKKGAYFRWSNLRVADIPNFAVLAALVDAIVAAPR